MTFSLPHSLEFKKDLPLDKLGTVIFPELPGLWALPPVAATVRRVSLSAPTDAEHRNGV